MPTSLTSRQKMIDSKYLLFLFTSLSFAEIARFFAVHQMSSTSPFNIRANCFLARCNFTPTLLVEKPSISAI